MTKGIILFGSMGVGDTTLGKEVSKQLNYLHVDLDDFHWRWDTAIPYTVFRSKEERTRSVMQAVSQTSHFVMSGSMWSIRKAFEPMFDMAVFMTAPPEICAERIRMRSVTRWGDRVLPGGDMYESSNLYKDYLANSELYEQDISPNTCKIQHEQWIKELPCPVIRVDGTKPISENTQLVVSKYLKLLGKSLS